MDESDKQPDYRGITASRANSMTKSSAIKSVEYEICEAASESLTYCEIPLDMLGDGRSRSEIIDELESRGFSVVERPLCGTVYIDWSEAE